MKKVLFLLAILFFLFALGGIFYFKEKNNVVIYEKENVLTENIQVIPENIESEEKNEPKAEIDDKKTEESPNLIKKENNVKNDIKIINKLVSWGFLVSQERKIDTIIIHSSYNVLGGDEFDFDSIIKEYKEYGVSPHYLIDRDGNIFRLVKDENIAYHAGESAVPDGRNNVNNFSIGIELINNEKKQFTNSQYNSLNSLINFLKSEYKIKFILGHNQIAPKRKSDPWNIDWSMVVK